MKQYMGFLEVESTDQSGGFFYGWLPKDLDRLPAYGWSYQTLS